MLKIKKMKLQLSQKLFAFIIAVMILLVMPGLVNAQKKCLEGHCPKGQVCVNGVCVKSSGGVVCNCLVRPIPFECGQICGFFKDSPSVSDDLSISGTKSNIIGFKLSEVQNVSLKIYDITGRLIKTLADKIMEQGNHQIEWAKNDEKGTDVAAGTYVLQFDTGNKSEIRKLSVIH